MTQQWRDPFTQQPPDKGYPDSVFTKVVIPAGLFLLALMSFLTNVKDIPVWAWAALVFFLGASSIVVVVPFGKLVAEKWRGRSARRMVVKLFYPRLELVLRRLLEHLSGTHSDTLLCELNRFASIRDGKGNVVVQFLNQSRTISEWIDLVLKRASKRRTRDIVIYLQAIDLAARHYNDLCRDLESRVQAVVNEKLLDENGIRQLRQAWNAGRETQIRLLHDWVVLGQEINQLLGSPICGSHFPQLKGMT